MRYLLLVLILSSCASRTHLPKEYLDTINNQNSTHESKRTTVVFLIDGLSYSVIDQQIQKNRLPNIESYFLGSNKKISQAHAVFPSLTFTNISGILFEKPVHETGSLGNKFIAEARLIDFESLGDRSRFSEQMRGNNIFTRLNQKKYLTVSLDYGLGVDATVSSGFDLQSGYSASQLDYRYLDRKKIDALKILLTESKPSKWPEFIFVHLVGLDFLSHRYGPRSIEALTYLQHLDQDLKGVLGELKKAEKNHEVISLLTSDHGFMSEVKKRVSLENVVKKINPQIRVINEGRMAALYYLNTPDENQILDTARQLLNTKGIEIVGFRFDSRVHFVSKSQEVYFSYTTNLSCQSGFLGIIVNGKTSMCTNLLFPDVRNLFYPYFIENMSSYFAASKSPDMVVIPEDKTVFYAHGKGFHGGPTTAETNVPLLMRNASFSEIMPTPASWQLLKFID